MSGGGGGGFSGEGGLLQKLAFRRGGLLERGSLIQLLRYQLVEGRWI